MESSNCNEFHAGFGCVCVWFFFPWKWWCACSVKGKLTSLVEPVHERPSLERMFRWHRVVWWEKVLSSCLLIRRFCCTGEWDTPRAGPTEAESAFLPQPLFPKMSYLEEKQNSKGTNLFSGSLEEHELFIPRNPLLSLHERESYY